MRTYLFKRIITENIDRNGSIDDDRAARAILQHRNTPIPEIGLSPAQLLLHRQLRDTIPTSPSHYRLHKDWVLSGIEREKAFFKRDQAIEERYNKHAKPLKPLKVQQKVLIQFKGKWNRSGRIVETLPNRQYRIRMDGSGRITLRNRRFLKAAIVPEQPTCSDSMILPGTIIPNDVPLPVTLDTPETAPVPISEQERETTGEAPPRLPKALRDLKDYNSRGLKEGQDDNLDRLRPRN